MKEPITEEMHREKEWFEEAKQQTIETLPDFMERIMNGYDHDYGTVCHAVAACALAAVWAANKCDGGGITGFQASFVMWDFIMQWMYPSNKCGLKLIDYDNMLYPQYAYRYEKLISPAVWNNLQREAKKNLEEDDKYAFDCVTEHWKSIAVDGRVPFGYKVSDEDI